MSSIKDFRVRFVCPHWDYDRWVVLQRLDLTLQEVMNTFWDYECPTHGPLHMKPFQGEEKKVVYRPYWN